MNMNYIPQMEPWFDESEATALYEYINSGGWVTEFKKTQEFERMVCEFTKAKYSFAVNNGTIGLTLALLAVGVEPGDEVIVPDLTMIATPNAAKLIGAKPVFVDVEPETLCLDIAKASEVITEKTKVIIHVSFNGRSNDLDKLLTICRARGIFLIEDAAQSLGSFFKKRHLGTIGDIGSFSFSAPKIISTGQGGMVVTNNDEIAIRLKKLKDFGRTSGGNDIHDTIGFNFKFTDIQAVIGIEQMKKLDWRIKRKKEIFEQYYNHLKDIEEIEFIKTDLDQTTPWFIDIFVDKPDSLQNYLKNHNIGSRRIYPPIHSQKAYNLDLHFPVTERYSKRGLWLPSSSKLKNEEITYICECIESFFRGKG